MPFNTEEIKQVEDIADLRTRMFFDEYLNETFPRQMREIMQAHDDDANAHGGVRLQLSRIQWFIFGAAAVSGFSAGALLPF